MTPSYLGVTLLVAVRLLTVAAIAAFTVTCAPAPTSPPQLAVTPATYLGFTQCHDTDLDNASSTFINETVLDTPEEGPTRAHEAAHRDQVSRFKSCKAFYEWYRNNRIRAEAEAFCAQAQAAAKENPTKITFEGAVWRYAHWLARYKAGTTHAQATRAINQFCKEH